jgi:glycosyltransferase involved in cell wall biosynthesis
VDTTVFRPNQRQLLKEKLGIDSPIVLFVGRLAAIKGVDVLLRAFHEAVSSAPGAHLVIVGRGPEESRLRELQRRLGLDQVFFLGGVPHEEMPFIYASSDLFVLPSMYEPFGNVVLEAMASGLPVLGSKVGGMADVIVNGETGYHLRPGDVKQLSNYLKLLLQESELRSGMSKTARQIAEERFDDMVVARTVEKIYEQCLGR